MKNGKRILLHLVFWIVYLGVTVFNELFLSPSFLASPSADWVSYSLLTQSLFLTVKLAGVYYTLYLFIPRWSKTNRKFRMAIEALIVSVILVFAYRMIMRYIIWEYFSEVPKSIPNLSMVARYVYSFMDILQVVAIAAAIKLARLRIAAIRNEKALLQEKYTSEIRHLKSQINPHFLFNTLNSIYALARSNSPNNAASVIQLSNILRYMLYETEKSLTGIQAELKNIDDYIALQQLRFGNRVRIVKDIQLDDYPLQITPLLILPLIENAYKHGAEQDTEMTEIRIIVRQEKAILNVTIENSFPNQKQETLPVSGIGLANIKRQLELLYLEHTFENKKENNIFRVNMRINTTTYAGFKLSDR